MGLGELHPAVTTARARIPPPRRRRPARRPPLPSASGRSAARAAGWREGCSSRSAGVNGSSPPAVLADRVARANALTPVTDDPQLFTLPRQGTVEEFASALLGNRRRTVGPIADLYPCAALQAVIPQDILQVPVEAIVRARRELADEFDAFRAHLQGMGEDFAELGRNLGRTADERCRVPAESAAGVRIGRSTHRTSSRATGESDQADARSLTPTTRTSPTRSAYRVLPPALEQHAYDLVAACRGFSPAGTGASPTRVRPWKKFPGSNTRRTT
ncbi:DUF6236 family protein [Kitasatospora sp. NPDC096077]|uniref:DUF6236 family protein n=1 Tax=Kitasatospora sp. NPDC096077 TaxID=3155544 RepID=UPI00331C47F7